MAAIADDTGLFVDALAGLPGVKSSRYAGPGCTYADNVRKLLDAMSRIEPAVARGPLPDGGRSRLPGREPAHV